MTMTADRPVRRERAFKGAVAGRERRKATVTGYRAGTQPLVELRLFRDERDPGAFIDFSIPQAREMLRLLSNAIAAHDGPSLSSPGREPVGLDSHHAGQDA